MLWKVLFFFYIAICKKHWNPAHPVPWDFLQTQPAKPTQVKQQLDREQGANCLDTTHLEEEDLSGQITVSTLQLAGPCLLNIVGRADCAQKGVKNLPVWSAEVLYGHTRRHTADPALSVMSYSACCSAAGPMSSGCQSVQVPEGALDMLGCLGWWFANDLYEPGFSSRTWCFHSFNHIS